MVMDSARQDEVIAIASDHAGFALKILLCKEIEHKGFRVVDLGTDSQVSVDYPDIGDKLALYLLSGLARYGVILCGTGIGVSIAANRYAGIRAALCHDIETARLGRQHNDANVLALGARIIKQTVAKAIVHEFLCTDFEGKERHARRVAKLDETTQCNSRRLQHPEGQ
jgi:ribose 5-phosphate isomerase B